MIHPSHAKKNTHTQTIAHSLTHAQTVRMDPKKPVSRKSRLKIVSSSLAPIQEDDELKTVANVIRKRTLFVIESGSEISETTAETSKNSSKCLLDPD